MFIILSDLPKLRHSFPTSDFVLPALFKGRS